MEKEYNFTDSTGFLDLGKILSYDASMNFVTTPRGYGKTYSVLKYIMKNIINSGIDEKTGTFNKQMMLVTRLQTESLDAVGDNGDGLLGSVFEGEPIFKEWIFKKKNARTIELAHLVNDLKEEALEKFILEEINPLEAEIVNANYKWHTAISVRYLSGTLRKSVSFNKVKYILFDEFQITDTDKRYIRGEVIKFLEFVNTIMRQRTDVKILMLSNAGSDINPYYSFFKYLPSEKVIDRRSYPIEDEEGNKIIFRTAFFNIQEKDMPDRKKPVNFIQAIAEGTEYGDKALTNDYGNRVSLISKLSNKAILLWNINVQAGEFSIYQDEELDKDGKLIKVRNIRKGFNPNARSTYTDDFSAGDFSLKETRALGYLERLAWTNHMRFSDIETQSIWTEILNKSAISG